MNNFAKYLGLTILGILYLSIPALFTLCIVFDWGGFLGWLFTVLLVVEVILFVFVLDTVGDVL